jgi:hypothetical protein
MDLGIWLVKHVIAPLSIYIFVSLWSICLGADSAIANILGVSAGFGITALASRYS